MLEADPVIGSTSGFSAPAGYRFPREVIALAVRWYLRYGLARVALGEGSVLSTLSR